MPKIRPTQQQEIESNSLDAHLKKDMRPPNVKAFHDKLKGHPYKQFKPISSLSELPDDIFIQVTRRKMEWQVILVDETLRVTVGFSDLEDSYELALKGALEQYAKNKGN